MYRVLFAEDELLVRVGLQNAIPWEKYSMELTAQADNGIEAYELFKKIRPDVVITDIRMEGMDGCELIRKIREIDKECAIIVISCLDDFEILRKLITMNINGYILKATISVDEVSKILEDTKEYLVRSGRKCGRTEKKENFLEERLKKYLLGQGTEPLWPGKERMKILLHFTLRKEDEGKINDLALKFIYDLLKRQLSEGVILQWENMQFYVFLPEGVMDMEKRIIRINDSIESFLGVQFNFSKDMKQKNENIKEWFERHVQHSDCKEQHIDYWDPLIQKAISFMQEHHGEALSLSEVATVAGVVPTYFSYLFKKETGKNYIEYLNMIRLEEVLKELRVNDGKISLIAEKHGFSNQEYFSRYFKKIMGISPSKWRQKNR